MNLAHVHLVLNHIPVIGAMIGLPLLAIGVFRKSEDVTRVGLGILVFAALAAIPTYLTGEPAEAIVESLPGVSKALIEPHEEAALIALIGIGVLGAAALMALVLGRRRGVARPLTVLCLAASLPIAGLMGWTANLGGQIHHPEVRDGFVGSPDAPREESHRGSGGEAEDEH